MHAVVETHVYLATAKRSGLTEAERTIIVNFLAMHPRVGDEIPGTGGARKIRFPAPGRGKRGGYRVITFYSGVDVPVFLMTVYSKSRKEDMTQAERNELKRELEGLIADYTEGITRYVKTRTRTH